MGVWTRPASPEGRARRTGECIRYGLLLILMGRLGVAACKILQPERMKTDQQMYFAACVLGWCIEWVRLTPTAM